MPSSDRDVSSDECCLYSCRDGVGTHGAGPAGDGPSAGFGSGSGSGSGPGPEQHLPTTCHPDNRSVLQSNNSSGETQLHVVPATYRRPLVTLTTVVLHRIVSLQLDENKNKRGETC